MASVFISYTRADRRYLERLVVQLAHFKLRGVVGTWDDSEMEPGSDVDVVVRENIYSADIILLLVSPDFLASKYAYGIEQKIAMERHLNGTAVVIPVILRDCDWSKTGFAWLLGLPKDGKPVRQWANKDKAYADIARGIEKVAVRINESKRSFNVNPATCEPDSSFGIRKLSLHPGSLSFVKWWDPGGEGYNQKYPTDRPNRTMAAYGVHQDTMLFNETYLSEVPDLGRNWQKHAHVWMILASKFPAFGDLGPGTLLRRIDLLSLRAKTLEGGVSSLEFFVPDDALAGPPCDSDYIHMRWIELPAGHDIFNSGPLALTVPFVRAFPIHRTIFEPDG